MFIHGDGHVHLHAVFALHEVLETAAARGRALGAPPLLLLAEVEGVDVFGALARRARGEEAVDGAPLPGGLALRATAEAESLAFLDAGSGSDAGYLVAGRQLVSSEGLEVLAVAPREAGSLPADGSLRARALVGAVRERDGAAVLPWGLGKWLGARGRVVQSLAADADLEQDPLVLLGDIAHRFWPWPEPAVFGRGFAVLAGSDPLPLRGAERNVGRYGFRVAGRLDSERPAASLLAALRARLPLERVGDRQSLPRVLAEQVRYRWQRRRSRRAA